MRVQCPDIAIQSLALYAECELLQCSMGSSLVSSARGHVGGHVCAPVCGLSAQCNMWCASVLSECAYI